MKRQIFTLSLFIGTLLLSAGAMKATTYNLLVNTSSLNGVQGSIDFQFNPGVGTYQSATVQLSNFVGGTAGTEQNFGSVTGGSIPTAVSITNGAGDNEVFDTYTFANTLALSLNFTGPAITSPVGTNSAGSLFTFSLYSDAAGTNQALTSNPNGDFAVSLSPQGAISSTSYTSALQVTVTPEPSTVGLLALPLALLALAGLRRRARA